MNQILALREKRADLWNQTKAFLDSHRGEDGMVSAEDNATYEKMEADVVALGKEIERLERQAAIDREMDQPTAAPLVSRPTSVTAQKQGRASDEYRNAFWGMIRNRSASPAVMNALQIGTDSEGGYLVPDEYERTWYRAWRRRTFSAPCAPSFRLPPATGRSRLWLPMVPRPGWMRKAPFPIVMTPSVRSLSALIR